ncbi:MAG: metallophosphoesterase family protein [Candidatus Omnitrophota bacterium]
MRYGIFSDIHSNIEALGEVISAYQKESIDKYFCIGDVVGYAANPQECIERVKKLAMVTVAGNHDWGTVNLFSVDYFNEYAKEALFWTRQNVGDADNNFLESLKPVYKAEDFTLVHGTLDSPAEFNYMTDGYFAEETFKVLETNLLFVGHTHQPGLFMKDKEGNIHYRQDSPWDINLKNKYIVDVGSVGQPRDGNPKAAYCIYDTDKKEVRIERVDYGILAAGKKIIDAGLPKFLGERLMIGR